MSKTREIANKLIDGMNDVTITSPVDGQLLKWNGTAWVNETGVIVKNGNVGIGVTPSAWRTDTKSIDIKTGSFANVNNLSNALCLNAYNDGSWKYKTNAPATNYEQYSGGNYWYAAQSGTAGNLITWKNTMILDQDGNINTLGNVNAGYVGGAFAPAGGYSAIYGGAGDSYTVMYGRNVSNTDAAFIVQIAGVTKARILANGSFQSATNSYGSTSDAKLKENVVDTSPKLDKLMQVQVRNFNYIGHEDKQIGVIAQEIEKIFPSIVYETKDTKQIEVTKTKDDGTEYKENETVETGEVTKNVKYSVIYMMMLKGMQEQQEIINSLQSRIEALEAKVK